MLNRSKLLLIIAVFAVIGIFGFGCDQPEDVVTPAGRANLTLQPERLPDNPSGTIYELWLANASDTVSLGQFGYEYATRKFLNPDGSDRPDKNSFFFDNNIDEYETILISVEPETDPNPSSPASIMLLDFLSSLTIKMRTPLVDSSWGATIRYNMKSTSDGIGTLNDGQSIWFSNYVSDTVRIIDTLSIADWHVDSTGYVGPGEFIIDTNIIGIDTNSIIILDTIAFDSLGLDTFPHTVVRFTPIISIDTSDYNTYDLFIEYTTDTLQFIFDKFSQDDFELINLSSYGWIYKGWVVSDVIDPSAVGKITYPAWQLFDPILNDADGGLLTTGTFYDVSQPDLANPYVDLGFKNPPRVPPFPGEDFLTNLPSPITSIPNLAGNGGHVFVTIEPVFYNDTTNFPLIMFAGKLPALSSAASAGNQGYTLNGYMYTNDTFRGFPSVTVTLNKF